MICDYCHIQVTKDDTNAGAIVVRVDPKDQPPGMTRLRDPSLHLIGKTCGKPACRNRLIKKSQEWEKQKREKEKKN